MEYVILLAKDPSELSQQVLDLVRHGWQPQGGVTLSQVYDKDEDHFSDVWAQAMVKPE